MAKSDRRSRFLWIGLATASILLGSCYPKGIGSIGPSGDRLKWPEMKLEQKKQHMAEVVLPRAGAVFRSWRPNRFTQVDCVLCHRSGPEEGNFQMPTDQLPRLSGEVFLGPEFKKYPETTRLKLNRLVPTMSEALGLRSFSVITRRGFGCYSCHQGPAGPMFGH